MKNYVTKRNDDLFGFNFFDNLFDDFFAPTVYKKRFSDMRTDVRETENAYELSVDMPGFDKSDIKLSLNDGYLNIQASREEKQEDERNYVKRERSLTCSRSYFVGYDVTEEDVKAKYENGTLNINVPKKQSKEIPVKNIEIE